MHDAGPPYSASETRRIAELVSALRTEVETSIDERHPLMTPGFADEFRSRLLSQHLFLGNPLFQESFDTAFIGSALAAGFRVTPAADGQRFWDVDIDGRKFSLKSSWARSLRTETLHISKLTEAAWIQDCRSAVRRKNLTHELFSEFCREVDQIIQLRYFKESATYEMVGIPVDLFRPILDVPTSEFKADGPNINIPVGRTPPDFTLKLDRSDAKITITRIRKSRCVVLGSWKIAE